MEKKELNNKVVFLFILTIGLSTFFAISANALGFKTFNARITNLEQKFDYLETKIFDLEVQKDFSENNIKEVYGIMYDISLDLNNYYYSDLISEKDFNVFQEKLITLTTIFLKNVELTFPEKKIIYFFCSSSKKECEYEDFVLTYINKKYEDVSVFGFNTDSQHPFIKLIFSKNDVNQIPLIVFEDKVNEGFLNLDELKIFLEIE